jgi:hypothetical protein
MCTTSDAKILVSIPSATLTSFSSGTETYDVLLILCIGIGNGAFEMPPDIARALNVSTVYSAIQAWYSARLRL